MNPEAEEIIRELKCEGAIVKKLKDGSILLSHPKNAYSFWLDIKDVWHLIDTDNRLPKELREEM